jgi:hypothetical protein
VEDMLAESTVRAGILLSTRSSDGSKKNWFNGLIEVLIVLERNRSMP